MKPLYLQKNILILLSLIWLLPAGCNPRETTPPYLSLLPHPSVTHHPVFSLRGKKNPGNLILINDQLIVPGDGSAFWSGEVTLIGGNNTFIIKSLNEFGDQSAPIQINVTLNTTAPSPPGSPATLTTINNPVLIQGNKDPDADVLLNGKEIVSFNLSPSWSFTYAPLQGTTLLALSSKNRIGNESAKVTLTVVNNGSSPLVPKLIAPLDGESVKIVPGVFSSLIFSWTNTLSFTYRFQISSTPDFYSPLIDSSSVPSSPYRLTSNLPSAGAYYWRVGSYDSLGTLFYSPSRKFFYGKITGDFNGDGYADILVGAEGTTGAGEVRIYFGGANTAGGTFTPKLAPDLTLRGENGGDLFGSALAVGDLNGDGYDDIIVGAYHDGTGGNRAGRVYIYFGGPTLHATPDMVLTGFSAGEQFGVSVASGQDINRDGFDDLLVGANLNSIKGEFTGRAYLFLGGKTLSSYPDMVFNGESPGDHFGISVAMGGDINGDGFSDFLIGAGGDGTVNHTGKAYLYYGEFETGNQPQKIFTGDSLGDAFGHRVSGLKDVNGDGYDDFIVGAPLHPGKNQEAGEGTANLFYGGPNLGSFPDLVLWGTGKSDQFGYTAAPIGDIPPKDGYADFVVGAYGGSTAGTPYAGWARIFKGNPIPGNLLFLQLSSGFSGTSESFGSSVSSPGDFNGDGFQDLIIGAYRADQSKGRAYYYDGLAWAMASTPPAWTSPNSVLYGSIPLEGFGIAVK